MNANRLARTAGLLYLVIAVTSGSAQLFGASLIVSGDAAATAAGIRDNAAMLRLAIAADLVGIAAFVGVAIALYFLFSRLGPMAAATLLACVVVSATIEAADLFNRVGALITATQPGYSDALPMLFMQLYEQGYLVAQVFFGLWLIPLGYLVSRSGWLPRVFGPALALAGVLYLVALVPIYASATLTSDFSVPIAMPAGLIEIAFALWLAVFGLHRPAGQDRPTADTLTPEPVR